MALSSWHRVQGRIALLRLFNVGSRSLHGLPSSSRILEAHDSLHQQGGASSSYRRGEFSLSGNGVPSLWMDPCSRGLCPSSLRHMSTKSRVENRKRRDSARREFKLLRRRAKLMKAQMTPEERLLWRLKRANRKKAVLIQRLKKYELDEDPEPVHDPELITPEQLQALKKVGYKNRNYVPIGRRGVYGGVVLNMHMHWKFHETVQIDCHIFKRDDIRTVARELTRLSGGIVIDIHVGTIIIMYRGRNYKQPKKQMTPENTLTKRKALFKSKYLQSMESINEHIENLHTELRTLRRKQKEAGLQSSIDSKKEVNKLDMSSTTQIEADQAAVQNIAMEELSEVSSSEEDDGTFDWASDSVDEDELSEAGDKDSCEISSSEDELSDNLEGDDSEGYDELSDSFDKDEPSERPYIDEISDDEFNYREAEEAHRANKKAAAAKKADSFSVSEGDEDQGFFEEPCLDDGGSIDDAKFVAQCVSQYQPDKKGGGCTAINKVNIEEQYETSPRVFGCYDNMEESSNAKDKLRSNIEGPMNGSRKEDNVWDNSESELTEGWTDEESEEKEPAQSYSPTAEDMVKGNNSKRSNQLKSEEMATVGGLNRAFNAFSSDDEEE